MFCYHQPVFQTLVFSLFPSWINHSAPYGDIFFLFLLLFSTHCPSFLRTAFSFKRRCLSPAVHLTSSSPSFSYFLTLPNWNKAPRVADQFGAAVVAGESPPLQHLQCIFPDTRCLSLFFRRCAAPGLQTYCRDKAVKVKIAGNERRTGCRRVQRDNVWVFQAAAEEEKKRPEGFLQHKAAAQLRRLEIKKWGSFSDSGSKNF